MGIGHANGAVKRAEAFRCLELCRDLTTRLHSDKNLVEEMNWDCAEERAALLDSAGIAEYERQLAEHLRACTVAVINGHAIRTVQTKFGSVFIVVGSKYAFTDFAAAQRHAYKLGERK